MVPTKGVEPLSLAAHGPEPCASANSATSASINPRKPFPVCALNNIAQVLHFASASRLFLSDFGQTHRKSNKKMARETGLEPATSTVTGWHSDQLSYSPAYTLLRTRSFHCFILIGLAMYKIYPPANTFSSVFLKKIENFCIFSHFFVIKRIFQLIFSCAVSPS